MEGMEHLFRLISEGSFLSCVILYTQADGCGGAWGEGCSPHGKQEAEKEYRKGLW